MGLRRDRAAVKHVKDALVAAVPYVLAVVGVAVVAFLVVAAILAAPAELALAAILVIVVEVSSEALPAGTETPA